MYQLPRVQLITPDDGHSRCPKHVEFRKMQFHHVPSFLMRMSELPHYRGRAITQAVRCSPVNVEIPVKFQAGPCGNSQSDIGTIFSPSAWLFTCHYHPPVLQSCLFIHHRRHITLVNDRISIITCLKHVISPFPTPPEWIYRVIQNDCRGVNDLSYTIHLR